MTGRKPPMLTISSLLLDSIRRGAQNRRVAASKVTEHASEALSPRSLDLTGIFHRDGRGSKFPERVLKGLDGVLPRIAMGHEPRLVRRGLIVRDLWLYIPDTQISDFAGV